MQSLDLEEALVQAKENRRLIKASRKLDRELEKCKENYQITKQILKQTMQVKMSYQNIIENAMQTASISGKMKLIIKRQKIEAGSTRVVAVSDSDDDQHINYPELPRASLMTSQKKHPTSSFSAYISDKQLTNS